MAVDADSEQTLEVLRGIEKQWNRRR